MSHDNHNSFFSSNSNYPQQPNSSEAGQLFAPQPAFRPFELTAEELAQISSPGSQATPVTEQVVTPGSDVPLPARFRPRPQLGAYYHPLQPKLSQPPTPLLQGSFHSASPTESFGQPVEAGENGPRLASPFVPVSGFLSGFQGPFAPSVASPANWPSPDLYPQFTWDQPAGSHDQSQHSFAPEFDDGFSRTMATSGYNGGRNDFNPYEPQEAGPSGRDDSGLAGSMVSQSPELQGPSLAQRLNEEIDQELQLAEEEEAREAPRAPTEAPEGEDGSRAGEPYAQLIYRAFMSRESHAMTLQEIYQWFRENTDKANSESKGWQNSIRHNLSMNAAFVKRDRAQGAEEGGSNAPAAKKSTEWVLQDWAVLKGVQSTTRYRKGNSTRRGGAASRANGGLPSRAPAARRGAVHKSVGARRSMLSQPLNPSAFDGLGVPYPPPAYQRPAGFPYPPNRPGSQFAPSNPMGFNPPMGYNSAPPLGHPSPMGYNLSPPLGHPSPMGYNTAAPPPLGHNSPMGSHIPLGPHTSMGPNAPSRFAPQSALMEGGSTADWAARTGFQPPAAGVPSRGMSSFLEVSHGLDMAELPRGQPSGGYTMYPPTPAPHGMLPMTNFGNHPMPSSGDVDDRDFDWDADIPDEEQFR